MERQASHSHRATFSQPSAPTLPLTTLSMSSFLPRFPLGWQPAPCRSVLQGEHAAGAWVCFRLARLFYNPCTDGAQASLWPMSSPWTTYLARADTVCARVKWVVVPLVGELLCVYRWPWTQPNLLFILCSSASPHCMTALLTFHVLLEAACQKRQMSLQTIFHKSQSKVQVLQEQSKTKY